MLPKTNAFSLDQLRYTTQGRSKTHCVRGDGLEPVIIEVEQHHLRLCSLQDQISKLLHLQTGLEGQLQLRAFDHDVGEVEQVDLHRQSNAFRTGKHIQAGIIIQDLSLL